MNEIHTSHRTTYNLHTMELETWGRDFYVVDMYDDLDPDIRWVPVYTTPWYFVKARPMTHDE